GELHLSVGVRPLGSTVRRLSLVSDPSVRIGSFQGGSSSSRVFWRPSSLATGREEPPLSISTMAGTSSPTAGTSDNNATRRQPTTRYRATQQTLYLISTSTRTAFGLSV